ncbi:MAG: serine/threonine protein kinase, partial [Deltaproteobacteria bacterium]
VRVVEAHDADLARAVALKLYPPVADARLDRELRREAQALARLEHPNVVRVFDVGEANLECDGLGTQVPYISMELVRGDNLRVWQQTRRPPRSEILRVLEEAAAGLAAAHAAGILHRDFKPENVMIDDRGRARVVDFGLAKGEGTKAAGDSYAPGDVLGEGFTAVGTIVGTYEYLAPEAREGAPTAASDQYAFALVAWEALAGVHPFGRRPAGDGVAQHVQPEGVGRIPRALRPILLRALAPAADDRFPDMAALATAWRRRLRRGRITVFGAAGTGALAAVAAFLVPRGVISTVRPTGPDRAGASVTMPDTPCRGLEGRWHFATVAAWSERARFLGANGRYQLDLRHLAACEFEVRLRKVGSTSGNRVFRYPEDRIRVGTAVATAERRGDGAHLSFDIGMASPEIPQAAYHFDLVVGPGERLVGTYAYRARPGAARDHAGYLRGGRAPFEEILDAAWDDVPCRLACNFVCPDEDAARACAATCEGTGLERCGPPTDAFVAPKRVPALLVAPPKPARGEEAAACAAAAGRIAGAWVLEEAGGRSTRVTLAAEGCRLRVVSGAYDEGIVSPDGPWRLDRNGRAAVALAGEGPAFGLTADGTPVAAYRLRAPTSEGAPP